MTTAINEIKRLFSSGSEIDRVQFEKDKSAYWKARAQAYLETKQEQKAYVDNLKQKAKQKAKAKK
jgi:hypothetical protein